MRCVAGPIDLTPVTGQRELEGIVFPQLLFHQDGHVISYEPPRGWTCTGGGPHLRLTPPKVFEAQASIEQAALPAPQTFDQATIEQLQQIVLGSLPPNAQNARFAAAESNPIRINQQDSVVITVGYSYFGQEYQTSVIFANLGDVQLRFRISARKEDFEELQRAFRASLFTLHWS